MSANSKMKTFFSSNDKSMNHESSSSLQATFEPIEVISNGGFPPRSEAAVWLGSLSSNQVKAELPARWCPTTKANNCKRSWFRQPKPVLMGKDNLIVNHILYSRIAEGGNFQFFHRAGLAKVSVKIVIQHQAIYTSGWVSLKALEQQLFPKQSCHLFLQKPIWNND